MEDDLKVVADILPFLIPVIIVELALMIVALVDLFRRQYYKSEGKLVWAIVIVIFGVIGPIVYLIFGRKERPIDGDYN